MAKIALSLSGGGFRASTFHLGTLSYLNHLKLSDGRPFLELVNTISTISGGTLTGLWYMMNLCNKVDTDASFKELYQRMLSVDILGKATDDYFNKNNSNTSFIKEMVKVYDVFFFNNETLGKILDNADNIAVKHFSANATDFRNGLQFRFQSSKVQGNTRITSGVIGNSSAKIPRDIASQIHLSEIFAASSCVTGAFEPLIFPTDFHLADDEKNKEYVGKTKEIGLMDGGCIDNQGIEPVLLLRERENIDIFIVSDSSTGKFSPYSYTPTKSTGWSIHRVNQVLNCVVLFFAQFLLWVPKGFWFGFFSSLSIAALLIRVTTALLTRKYIKKGFSLIPFHFDWKPLLNVPFNKWADFFITRGKSVLMLATSINFKHIRKLNYASVWEDEQWENRRIMNALYELRADSNAYKDVAEEDRDFMKPSELIEQNSQLASRMSTTLWFPEDDRKQNIPAALFSSGQYNICWNLLEYVLKIKSDPTNTSEEHKLILECEQQLRNDWQQFQKDPQWLFKQSIY